MGWPNGAADEGSDLTRFYSKYGNSCLETGYDILFFWVARMVMLGTELTGKVPFNVVYMHGLVRDAQGKKMSKTTGNVVDPLEVIKEYGTDALRYTLVTGVTPGLDVPLDPKRIESNRNFANKLWNSARFILSNLQVDSAHTQYFCPRPDASASTKFTRDSACISVLEASRYLRTFEIPDMCFARMHLCALGTWGLMVMKRGDP